jgi:acyl-CoA reductase-like NAD-dependent aldehyde dehydrogenase
VRKVAFTGSDATGQRVYESAARGLKRVSMELGGKSPNIVFEDADLDNAIKGVISGIFAATGQTCIAGSRLLVQQSIHDRFLDKLVAFAKTAKMGDPMDAGTQIGPVTNKPQLDKILKYIDIAKNEGARAVLGGRRASRPECGNGWFVEPTIFAGVRNSMRIAQEEVFGPVLTLIHVETLDDAIGVVNRSRFGNGTSIFTENGASVRRFRHEVQTGMIGVNIGVAAPVAFFPFSGWKDSFLGDLHAHGPDAVEFFTRKKTVTSRWFSSGQGHGEYFVEH